MCLKLSAVTEEKEIRQAGPSFKTRKTLHSECLITVSSKSFHLFVYILDKGHSGLAVKSCGFDDVVNGLFV